MSAYDVYIAAPIVFVFACLAVLIMLLIKEMSNDE